MIELSNHPSVSPVRRYSAMVPKISKSLAVSVVTTVLSLSILAVLAFTGVVPAAWANVIATVAGIGPSYALNRRWVWRRTGPSSVGREVIPFWSMSLLALAVSTWTVATGARWADAHTLSDAARTAVVLIVNLLTFASLWMLQFTILDRVLFHPRTETLR